MNQLEQLKQHTVVVADTGDIQSIRHSQPQDATTNPSLILNAAMLPEYKSLLDQALAFGLGLPGTVALQRERALDELSVLFGVEILKHIPGRVSIEVDARLSFHTAKTVEKALYLIKRCKAHGVSANRILIKIAATWEGIQAVKILEAQGIHCNVTLVFHFAQAVAAAQAGAFLISPFVGRIYDWYLKQHSTNYTGLEDPGVQSVHHIYHYFKAMKIPTIVMGASFRNIGQIQALCGCDYLTISPALLARLQNEQTPLPPILSPQASSAMHIHPVTFDEPTFRYTVNSDPMATEKLAEGIRLFVRDAEKLETMLGIH